jgi:hypothetical protein
VEDSPLRIKMKRISKMKVGRRNVYATRVYDNIKMKDVRCEDAGSRNLITDGEE